jgi:Uma2 family endonuclease
MNVGLRTPMTLQGFRAGEERQELRCEFDGVQPIAMTGGIAAHSAIQTNLITALQTRLRGKPCQPHGSPLKIQVVGHIRYPDAFIVCMPLPPQRTVVTEPVVVFEILSPSSTGTDMIIKNAEYRATPSLKRYVILEQTSPAAMVFYHTGEDWVSELLIGPEAVLRLPDAALEIPLAEIYPDVDFAETPAQ